VRLHRVIVYSGNSRRFRVFDYGDRVVDLEAIDSEEKLIEMNRLSIRRAASRSSKLSREFLE